MGIYTKSGDKGKTSLIGGRRVSKSDAQVEVYGQLDELNSWIGLLASGWTLSDDGVDGKFLENIQWDLFRIGGFYSFDFAGEKGFSLPFIEESDVRVLEEAIDRMEARLPVLKHFILPGGVLWAAWAHVARTVCRRCERTMARFAGIPESEADREVLAKSYVNRLSDLLFVLARYENFCAGETRLEENNPFF